EDTLQCGASGTGDLHTVGIGGVLIEQNAVIRICRIAGRREIQRARTGEGQRAVGRREIDSYAFTGLRIYAWVHLQRARTAHGHSAIDDIDTWLEDRSAAAGDGEAVIADLATGSAWTKHSAGPGNVRIGEARGWGVGRRG